MSDFSKTKKRQNNKNRQVSFFVKYMFLLSNQFGIKHFSKSMHIDVFLALYENIRICILLLFFLSLLHTLVWKIVKEFKVFST